MRLVRLLILLSTAIASGAATAQTWPTKPIRLITAFATGSAPDIVCRVMADRLTHELGEQVIVDNRPGGSSIIAAQAVAHAPADGYTFFFATTAPLVTNQLTFKSLPYSERDFAPVAMIGKNPFLVLVSPELPVKTMPELVAYEKGHSGELSFASDGPRNFSGMIGAWLNKVSGMHMVQVPYANMPVGIRDTIAGRTQVTILAFAAAQAFMKSGQLHAIAKTGPEKIPGFEPMAAVDQTYRGFDFGGWFALVAPSGTPDDVVLQMNQNIDKVLQDPEVIAKLDDIGVTTSGADTPQGLAEFIGAESDRWEKIVHEIGIAPE
ncbi:MAG: tripartite tricarboxylate transporter substrate binding protein [Alphaproteobacteria bacterium]|nr:tripartite tricarboxylate transporter substrate binding protein [Alphaproteobacteria bacterium]